ncbi:MAG: helix-turn-helix transcriptional regulator [Gemmatimonadaceae bacterium]|nr:helix-turn-helix transcriptional regulator [Chitinophagaceae bacterium]
MISFQFIQKDFTSWLNEFAGQLGLTPDGQELVIPASLGSGTISALNITRDLSLLVMDCSFHEDLELIRDPSQEYGIILFFNQVEISRFFRIRSGENEMTETSKSRNNIFLSSTNMELDLYYSGGSKLKRVGIYFSPAMVKKFVRDDMQLFLTVYTDRGLYNVNRESINFELKTILDDIFQTTTKDDFGRLVLQNRVLLLTEKFLHNLLAKEVNGEKKNHVKKEDIERIQTVEKILTQSDLEKFPSINELSRMAMMSSTKLKTRFKEVYGMKLYEYYNRHRLQKAREMIIRSGTTIKDAAYSIGFSNLSNFSRAFKKEFGLLPTQLRANG